LDHAVCGIIFDSLVKFDVTCDNVAAPSQLHLR